MIVPFAPRVHIQLTLEEPPIVTKVALLAHTSVILPLQPNTTMKTIAKIAMPVHSRHHLEQPPVQFAVLANIQTPPEEQTIATIAVLVHTSVILPP
jgi:hypothetical protein